MTARQWLMLGLAGLLVLFAAWFAVPGLWALFTVFALPPLLLLLAVLRGSRTAPVWASILALLWFSHGVMEAWAAPQHRGFALTETALALLVIFAASLPGMRARFAARRGSLPGNGH